MKPSPTEANRRAAFAVTTTGLTKRYGARTVVNDLTIAVPSGSVCGFIGRNGAGKTTTIRMLLGLVRPTSGQATVLGHSITSPRAFLEGVGAMIEGPAFYPTLTARKNLEVLTTLGKLPKASIDRVLETVGLDDRGEEAVKGFSLGMRQRLGIAAALLPNPRLLVLDEPTNGLDPQGIREIRELLRSLADGGITVLVSSHLLDELQHISDHLVLINEGNLTFEGSANDLLARAQTTLVAKADTANATTQLAFLLRNTGQNVSITERGVTMDFAGSFSAAAVNRLAHEHGIILEHLTVEQPRLEDIFFSLTNSETTKHTHEVSPSKSLPVGALAS
jgi:ABC-2 type transport system ATP-binding protein